MQIKMHTEDLEQLTFEEAGKIRLLAMDEKGNTFFYITLDALSEIIENFLEIKQRLLEPL